jgi:retron-type reverse transcriptase
MLRKLGHYSRKNRRYQAAQKLRPRRVYLPKTGGRQRPLVIAALEDKVVQQAVRTVLVK